MSKKDSTQPQNAQERIQETRAFYEGDIVKIDEYQKGAKEVYKKIKWYEWDFVFVLPNPDHGNPGGKHIDSVHDAVNRYKRWFKTIYRESQVEMKKERKMELELVENI